LLCQTESGIALWTAFEALDGEAQRRLERQVEQDRFMGMPT
jgi:hypothetical protein